MAFANNNVISGGLNGEGTRSAESFATEVWGPAVEVAIKEKLVLDKICNDLSPLVASQGEIIHLPKIEQITSGDKGEGAISWATGATDAGEETLNVDKHKYAAAVIEDVIEVQGNYDMLNLFAKELGYSIANAVDTVIDSTIIDSFKTSSGLENGINLSATPMGAEADFDLIASTCFVDDPDPSNWTIVLTPGTYANLMNIADLSLAAAGAALGASYTQTGVVSRAYGFNIMMSQNVTTATTNFHTAGTSNIDPLGYVVHKSCAHIAFSKRARLQSQYDVDFLGTKVIADTIFGCMARYSSTNTQRRAFLLST